MLSLALPAFRGEGHMPGKTRGHLSWTVEQARNILGTTWERVNKIMLSEVAWISAISWHKFLHWGRMRCGGGELGFTQPGSQVLSSPIYSTCEPQSTEEPSNPSTFDIPKCGTSHSNAAAKNDTALAPAITPHNDRASRSEVWRLELL